MQTKTQTNQQITSVLGLFTLYFTGFDSRPGHQIKEAPQS
nr:MAG TPA: Protein of unknown function (DUF3005) [Caudoviricetes sp.]